jgi:membrane protein
MFGLLKRTVHEFIEDDCPAMAAAIAYYTIFSLPPLLLVVITVTAPFFGQEAVQQELRQQIATLTGQETAREVQTLLDNASKTASTGWLGLGLAALLFGATTAFAQLQAALNRAWEVKPDPAQGGFRNFLGKRLLSFGMVLAIGFLLLVSLALSAALSAFGEWIENYLPGGISGGLLQVMYYGVAFLIVTILFAAIFKFLPDAKIAWRDVGVGAVLTALLFVTGKFLMGFYIGKSDIGNTFGAAGSLALILLWTYYSSMVLLLGAEFTEIWAEAHGKGIEPEPGAVRVVQEKHEVRDPQPA